MGFPSCCLLKIYNHVIFLFFRQHTWPRSHTPKSCGFVVAPAKRNKEHPVNIRCRGRIHPNQRFVVAPAHGIRDKSSKYTLPRSHTPESKIRGRARARDKKHPVNIRCRGRIHPNQRFVVAPAHGIRDIKQIYAAAVA
jgi:hypothetical protein